MTEKTPPLDIATVEACTRKKFSGQAYSPETICRQEVKGSREYFDVLLALRMDLLRPYLRQARVLDLCCATGEHLLDLAPEMGAGIGLDFSHPFLRKALRRRSTLGCPSIQFAEGNARQLPFRDGAFDLVYSFSSLYLIPRAGEILQEVSRVLRPGGLCVLELGNLYSLNTLVCRARPDLAAPHHISVTEMKGLLARAPLRVIRHRAFQILPFWGRGPFWLKPLLHPAWKRLLQRRAGGRMLDEWISNLPGLRRLAFRHIFVCQKPAES